MEFKSWPDVPDNLKSKTKLYREGKKPNGPVRGRVYQRANHKWIDLYDINETDDRPKATKAQLAALEKGRENQTCKRCGKKHRKKKLINGYCQPCLNEMEREKQAVEPFRRWYNTQDWIILDTETTGLSNEDEIIEITVVAPDGKILFDSLVNTKVPVSDNAFAVHGIDDRDLVEHPSWPDIWRELAPILQDKRILIYNAAFDTRMIYQTCEHWDCDIDLLNTECVMEAYSKYIGAGRWLKLEYIMGHNGHRAKDDCLATLGLIRQVWDELGLTEKGVS